MAGQIFGAIRRAGQQDRRTLRALRHQDDGIKLHAVPHRNHRLALAVIEAIGGLGELRGSLAGIIRIGRLGRTLSIGLSCSGDDQNRECDSGRCGMATIVDHEANLSETSDEGNLESLGDGLCDARTVQASIFDDHHNRKLRTRPLAWTKRLLSTVCFVFGLLPLRPHVSEQPIAGAMPRRGINRIAGSPRDSPPAREAR